jgi:hypothetical protein
MDYTGNIWPKRHISLHTNKVKGTHELESIRRETIRTGKELEKARDTHFLENTKEEMYQNLENKKASE